MPPLVVVPLYQLEVQATHDQADDHAHLQVGEIFTRTIRRSQGEGDEGGLVVDVFRWVAEHLWLELDSLLFGEPALGEEGIGCRREVARITVQAVGRDEGAVPFRKETRVIEMC